MEDPNKNTNSRDPAGQGPGREAQGKGKGKRRAREKGQGWRYETIWWCYCRAPPLGEENERTNERTQLI